MNYKTFILCSVCLLMLVVLSCANWHTLKLETKSQPIQFGPHSSTTEIDTLSMVSGYYAHHFEEDTYSESENTRLASTGGDSLGGNLNNIISRALGDDPRHFIADGRVMVEVKRGISVISIFEGILFTLILGGETEFGSYSTEIINYNGVLYKIKQPKNDGN